MNTGLTNKIAMVAGASRGLGFAVARALAKEGAKVSISSRDAAAINAAANLDALDAINIAYTMPDAGDTGGDTGDVVPS